MSKTTITTTYEINHDARGYWLALNLVTEPRKIVLEEANGRSNMVIEPTALDIIGPFATRSDAEYARHIAIRTAITAYRGAARGLQRSLTETTA